MYILNWLSSCASVSSLASSAPVWKAMPAASSQDRTAWASASGTVAHLRDERALRQPLLVDPQRVEQLVVDDRVVHPHAALVEDADDGLLAHELGGERAAQVDLRAAAEVVEVAHVAGVVDHPPGLQPGPQPVARPVVGEVLAPQRRVGHAGLGQAADQVEHPDQTGPLAAPVRHDEDRAAVAAQARQHVVAVLPHRLDHDERRVGRDGVEHLDPHPLAVDEAVPLLGVDGMGSAHAPAERLDGGREVALELLLHGPARHVGARPHVAARDGVDGAGLRGGRRSASCGRAYVVIAGTAIGWRAMRARGRHRRPGRPHRVRGATV